VNARKVGGLVSLPFLIFCFSLLFVYGIRLEPRFFQSCLLTKGLNIFHTLQNIFLFFLFRKLLLEQPDTDMNMKILFHLPHVVLLFLIISALITHKVIIHHIQKLLTPLSQNSVTVSYRSRKVFQNCTERNNKQVSTSYKSYRL